MDLHPPYLDLGSLDRARVRSLAWEIINSLPESERGNSSGKFYRNYRCWHFHKSSEHPLVRDFVASAELSETKFRQVYGRPMRLDFVILSYVEDASEEVCLWHRDGYFFNGQAHLTVEGGANIEVELPNGTEILRRPAGAFWYLNGSSYRHRILPTCGPRIEICAPVEQRVSDVERKAAALPQDSLRLLQGSHPDWIELRREQARYVLDAVRRNTASNSQVAEFSVDPQ
jgi:hypothetical protein